MTRTQTLLFNFNLPTAAVGAVLSLVPFPSTPIWSACGRVRSSKRACRSSVRRTTGMSLVQRLKQNLSQQNLMLDFITVLSAQLEGWFVPRDESRKWARHYYHVDCR